jgi:hypothetical protein
MLCCAVTVVRPVAVLCCLQPLTMPPVALTWDVEPCPYIAAAAGTVPTSETVAAACSTHSHPHHHHEHQQQQQQQQNAFSSSSSSSSCTVAAAAATAAAVEQAPDSVGCVSEGRSRRRSKDSGAVVYVTLRLKTGRVSYNIGALWWCARLCARTLCCACPLQLPPPMASWLTEA